MSVDQSVVYVPNPESLPTTDSYYTPIKPSNGSSFSPGSSIYIDVPAMRNGYLDPSNSWIEFAVVFSTTGAAGGSINDLGLTSAGAAGLISSLYSWSSSNANLETITNYAELARMLAVTTQDQSINNSIRTLTGGIKESALQNNRLIGEAIAVSAAYVTMKFAMPLVSSVFGTLANGRYVPLALLSGSTRLQLDLVADGLSAICNQTASGTGLTSATFTITDVSYQAKIVRVSDASQQAIVSHARQDNNGIVSWSGVGWRNYSRSIDNLNAGAETFLVPARYRSLNCIIWGVRVPKTNAWDGYDQSSTYNSVSDFTTRIGGISYPTVAPATVASQVQFLMGCFHATSNTLADTVMSKDYYSDPGTTIVKDALLTDSFKCYMGVSYESFNDSSGSVNGLDCSSDLVEVLLNKSATTGGSTSSTIVFHTQFDVLYSIDPDGNMSISF